MPTNEPAVLEGEALDAGFSAKSRPLGELLNEDVGQKLSTEEKQLIVRQAILLLEQFYVHLPVKRSLYAVDPVRQLRLLEQCVEQFDNVAFHREMADIMVTVRDLHTHYLLPHPFSDQVAFLPFQVEHCVETGTDGQKTDKYIVTSVQPDMQGDISAGAPEFARGVEIVAWSGVPIERALTLVADRSGGGNRSARMARGLARLTARVLAKLPPPDEEWVIVAYRTPEGAGEVRSGEIRVAWRVAAIGSGAAHANLGDPQPDGTLGYDLEYNVVGQLRKALLEQRTASPPDPTAPPAAAPQAPRVFAAEAREGFAYIRLRSFDLRSLGCHLDDFANQFAQLLQSPELPQNGLILDVRDNPGGSLLAAEKLLQMLTPRRIEPARFQVINTPGMLDLCTRTKGRSSSLDFSRWSTSVKRGVEETGVAFSSSFPISEAEALNDRGQLYYGPVVLITNALCYSATDLFTASFKDHEIGQVLGVHDTTGAGGANVFTHELLHTLLADAAAPGSAAERLAALPRGAGLRVAIRRTLRAGKLAGTEIEDIGVESDRQHDMTRNDILDRNADLIKTAARMLQARQRDIVTLNATIEAPDAERQRQMTINVTGDVDHVAIYIDGIPNGSVRVTAGHGAYTVKLSVSSEREVRLQALSSRDVKAERRISLRLPGH